MKPITLYLSLMSVLGASPQAAQEPFRLSSPDVAADKPMAPAHVMSGFGCKGKNRSPALAWTDPSAGARSLALTMYDPDAPTGRGWWHWVTFDLPVNVRRLRQNAGNPEAAMMPKGAVQLRNDFGTFGYGGACPPAGAPPHRYVITLWALDVERLPFDRNAKAAEVGAYLKHHAVGQASLTTRYGR